MVPLSKGHFCMSSLLSPTPASYGVPEQGESRSFRPNPRAPSPPASSSQRHPGQCALFSLSVQCRAPLQFPDLASPIRKRRWGLRGETTEALVSMSSVTHFSSLVSHMPQELSVLTPTSALTPLPVASSPSLREVLLSPTPAPSWPSYNFAHSSQHS